MLRRKGVRVVSITEHADDSPTGKLMEAIIESVDEFYSENLAQEVTRGMREAASRGFFLGSKAPFGYKRVKVSDGAKERPTLKLDPATAPIVREVFESSLMGNGLKEICKELNERGITNKGWRWHKTGLYYLLTNEAYTGTSVWGRTTKGDKEPDPVRVEGAWEALVSRDLFENVQQGLKERAPKVQRPARVGSKFLLSGLLLCGTCGKPYIGQGAKSGQYGYYVCGTLHRQGAGTCQASYLNAPKVEGFVIDKIDDRQSIREIAVLVGGGLKPLRISDKAEAPQGPLPRHESTRNRLPGLAEFAGRCLVGFQRSGLHLLSVGRSDYSDFSRESLCVSRGQLPVWFAALGVGLPTVWNSPIASGTRAKLIPSRACPSSQSTSATSAPSAVQMPNSSSTSVTVMVMVTSTLSSLVPSEATTVTS